MALLLTSYRHEFELMSVIIGGNFGVYHHTNIVTFCVQKLAQLFTFNLFEVLLCFGKHCIFKDSHYYSIKSSVLWQFENIDDDITYNCSLLYPSLVEE